MQIRGTETKKNEINIEITVPEVWKAMRNAICKKHGIGKDWFLKADGHFYEEDDHGHGRPEDVKQIKATKEQKRIMALLKDLQEAADLNSYETWDKV